MDSFRSTYKLNTDTHLHLNFLEYFSEIHVDNLKHFKIFNSLRLHMKQY